MVRGRVESIALVVGRSNDVENERSCERRDVEGKGAFIVDLLRKGKSRTIFDGDYSEQWRSGGGSAR